MPDFFLDGGIPPSPSGVKASRVCVQTPAEGGGAEVASARGGGGGRRVGSEAGWDCRAGERGGGGGGGGEGEGDGYQLEVTVYSHRVVGEGYGSHTEYTVLATASLPRFARREMEVARR